MIKKNLIYTFILFILLGINACTPEENKENNNTDSSKTVVETDVKDPVLKKMDYEAPTELTYGVDSQDYLYDTFYPIGWSEDGHFAYVSEPADQATGYYFFTFVILDTKTNEIVWTWKIDEKDGREDSSVSAIWKEKYELFKKQLNDYQIKQQTKMTIEQFPVKSASGEYEQETKLTKTKDPFGYGFDVIDNATVNLKSKDKTKGVINQNLKEEAYLSLSVLGYVKSPYQERVVVFIKKEMRGYEGPPNVILYQTAGCS